MRVAVCMKCVPPLSSPRSVDGETFRIVRDSLVLNAPDLHALEEALRLRDSLGEDAVEVVTVTVGGPHAATPLRDTFALGAARCVLVSDAAIVGSDVVATSRVLAAALERVGPDLILFGQEANDSNGALLWAAVAERLRMPMVARATRIDMADGRATIRRQSEHGTQTVEAPLPCILSVASSANQPRYATLKAVVASRSRTCDVLPLAELGLDPSLVGPGGSGTSVRLVERVPSGRAGRIVEDCDAGAAVLVQALSERGLL